MVTCIFRGMNLHDAVYIGVRMPFTRNNVKETLLDINDDELENLQYTYIYEKLFAVEYHVISKNSESIKVLFVQINGLCSGATSYLESVSLHQSELALYQLLTPTSCHTLINSTYSLTNQVVEISTNPLSQSVNHPPSLFSL